MDEPIESSDAQPFDASIAAHQQVCPLCAARVEYVPGTRQVACPYCGHAMEIVAPPSEAIAEQDLATGLAKLEAAVPATAHRTSDCGGCGARIDLGATVTAIGCPYCGLPVVSTEIPRATLPVQALLPFSVTRDDATRHFARWVRSRWLVPRGFRRWHALENALQGVYVPYWTVDSRTVTRYDGQRGEDYWETTHVTRVVNGRSQRVAQRVKHTRWYSVSGTVKVDFDDVLVPATATLDARLLDRLEPWDLAQLEAYHEHWLAGFMAESYGVDLQQGFSRAGEKMRPTIESAIRRDIGGDHQRIGSTDVRHHDVTYKHVLLPVWISVYRFKDKAYRVCVNARTGEVHGERPWSRLKIAALVLLVLVAAAVAASAIHARTRPASRPQPAGVIPQGEASPYNVEFNP
jgi:DNA-directed RNA polymerase subunit RPC12/RpoP